MSELNGAGNGSDPAPDSPRRESAAVGVDRGTILTTARDRRECALAYRAVVDAVYAETALDVGAPEVSSL
jgi:hypothetical protein